MAEPNVAHPLINTAAVSAEVLPTDIPGLDLLLGGGLPRGHVLLLVGTPGSGKTILSQQLCFNVAADASQRAIYFSTLTEPHDKLVRQIELFSFFQRERLGQGVILLALQEFLTKGLEATAEVIVRTVRQHQASFICIDGFRAIEASTQNNMAIRQFVYQLSSQLHMLGSTALITLEEQGGLPDTCGVQTIADGVLICHYDVVGVRHKRQIEVKKLRAMAPLDGLHTYRIDTAGWSVFPRIESLIPHEIKLTNPLPTAEQVSLGLTALDHLMGGGVLRGSTSLIMGERGMGKTLFALHFVQAGLQASEPTLFLSFHDYPEQLLAKADTYHLPLVAGIESGLLTLRSFAPVGIMPDEISLIIRQAIADQGIRRLVIDGVFELERATSTDQRTNDYFGGLTTSLHHAGVTTCMTRLLDTVVSPTVVDSSAPLVRIAENVILLQNNERELMQSHTLSIQNMCNAYPDRRSYRYEVTPTGLMITGVFDTQDANKQASK